MDGGGGGKIKGNTTLTIPKSYNELATLISVTGACAACRLPLAVYWVPVLCALCSVSRVCVLPADMRALLCCLLTLISGTCRCRRSLRWLRGFATQLPPSTAMLAPGPAPAALTAFASLTPVSHWAAGEDAIRHLFSRGTHREFGYAAIIVMLCFYFLGAAWTGGCGLSECGM